MADPANTPLGKMLLDEITPVVMVLRTPLVEESCRKNNLSLVQMLSPFCNFNNIDVPVRTVSDTPYRIRKFKLRLFYASDIRQPNIEAAKERLKDFFSQAGETDVSEMYSDPPTIETVMTRSESEIVPSWFQYFNKELVRTLSFSEHETFDHPVTCLLVVSSKDVQPINRFVDLFNTNQLPSLLNDGAMDPKILKHYLLLHDNQDGELDKASKVLTEMRNTFGLNDCQLLCINSASSGSADHPVNLWALDKMDSSLSQHIGGFLDADDLNEVRDLMQELSTRHIIPYMEQKIRVLNQQVASTRKGFRNQIKNLWWRKGKDDAGDTSNGTMYTFSSFESQIRVLGDYAFMLRDYELALSNYRLISTDYKLDKAWKRYAGVQEMMGLTYFLLDQSRKDAESCMEIAFSTYMNLGSSGLRNAIRCGLWWVEMLKKRGQYKEAASVYFRIPGEEPLHSAVMLEQSSYCYLFCKPPMLRKYGFHLVLSGDRYKKCDQIKHAIRTYRGATSVYRGTTWSHAKDHVNFHIGKWYANLGIFDVAVSHMMEVLPCGHQSKTTQESFLNDFLRVVKQTGRTFEVMGLKLPKINMSSLKVLFEDHRTYASPAAVSVKESAWRTMEEDLIPTLSTAKTNWLDSQPRLISKNYKDLNVCVAGEAIKVEMEFRNPLQIPIAVTGVCLICELSARSDEKEHAVTGQELLMDEETAILKIIKETSSGNSSFSLSEVDFSLAGGETIVVHLTVTPNVEGLLKLVGLKWKLSGSITGFCGFESNLVKKKPPKGRRKSRNSPRNKLQFMVIKSLPRLEGSIHSIPEKVFEGDVQRLLLELRNLSEYPVKNVKMKISHPRFLGIGSQEDLSMEFPAGILKNNNTNQSSSEAGTSELPHSICKFPEDIRIQGKTSFSWPLWLRAAVPGNISLNLSIYYEMGDESIVIRYRTLRMLYTFLVLPSLDVSFQINPSPSRLEEFIVRMDVVNKTSSESFLVHQLSCVGYQWEVSLLYPVDRISSSQILTAGQATSCFFKLKKGKSSGDNVSSHSPLTSSDVVLGSECGEALYDIACSPLADFHYLERLRQGMSLPIHPSADFVLICRPGRNKVDPDLSDNSHLFTHHACHCSLSRMSPISWRLDGPRRVQHDFSISFVEVKLRMAIYNSSEKIVSVRITMLDTNAENVGQSSDATAAQVGWLDVSSSDVVGAPVRKPQPTIVSFSPFVWSGSSTTKVEIGPLSTIETPLQICVFSSGTYDLSNYQLHWSNRGSNEMGSSESSGELSGVCQGYPYYLTALQSA